jgi:hypothetical protein
MSELPPPITAIYSHEINQPIPLYQGVLEVDDGKKLLQRQGTIDLVWYPLPAVWFRLDLSEPSFLNSPAIKLSVPEHGVTTKATLRKVVTGDRLNYLEGNLDPYDIGTGDQLSYIILHIVNFPAYIGTWIENASCGWAGRLTLISEQQNWKLTIDAPYNCKDIQTNLDSQGGYAITNTAKLERNNGEMFTAQQAEEIMIGLCYFLSFVAGRWVSPILPVGFDANNNKIWEKWFYFKLAPYQNPKSNWFPSNESFNLTPKYLGTPFRGFLKKYFDDNWQEPIKLLTSLYVESNNSGVEQAIITTQPAFELLFWLLFVEQLKCLSKESVEKLNASDKLRLLFSHLQIPLQLPEPPEQYFIEELTKLSKSENLPDRSP